ncbi:MAG: ribulose-phosphate 3-epimerase [Candidatus Cryptobacteroides sp.]
MKVAPSILTADFLHLEKELKAIDKDSDYIHLDIMDGTLVPNISFGFPVIEAVAKAVSKPMDAHLMVVNPDKWFEKLASLGVQMVSFHLEASGRKTAENLQKAQKLGMKAGIAINPDVPVEKLYRYIGKADFFLIMSVFAGFGGQKFIYESLDRVGKLKAELLKKGSPALIEVDGGVGLSNAAALREAGADIVVAGSAVLGADDPAATIRALQEA